MIKFVRRFLVAVLMSWQVLPVLAEPLAKDVIIVFDNSGSMRKADPSFLATKAVAEFVDSLDGDSRAAVEIFDTKVNLAVPLTPINGEGRKAVIDSLKQINYRGKWTDSPAAMERALYELKVNGREGVEKLVVFMTDGIVETGNPAKDADRSKWLREELAQDFARNNVKIFAIAFTELADFQLIQSLATKTNGEYYRALKAGELHEAFSRVSAAIAKLAVPKPVEPAPVAAPAATSVPAVPPAPAATAPAAPATAPAVAPTAEVPATSAPVVPAPAAGAAAEKKAAEEFAKATGLSKEELEKLPEGQAIIVKPAEPAADKAAGVVLIAVVVVGVLLAIVATVVIVKAMRRKGGDKAVPAAGEEDYVPQAFLKDLQGNTNASQHTLGAKPVMLGRVAGTDDHLQFIVVNQTTVGRRHALIEYKDFSFWIVDQGSVNGTFVNGQRVDGEHRLKHGDRIRLHKYEFEFMVPEVADAGKTVFAGADKTVLAAEATMTSAAPMAAAVATPVPAPAPVVAEDDDMAFDVTGGSFKDEPPAAPEAASVEPAGFDIDETPAPAAPGATDGTVVLDASEKPDFHEVDTVIRNKDFVAAPAAVPVVAETPVVAQPAPPSAPAAEPEEEMSLDAFISTTVLEAAQIGTAPPRPAAPPPPPAPAPAAAAEKDVSLDDFFDETKEEGESDKTAFISYDDNGDHTLMPSQVPAPAPGKKPAVPEPDNTHMGDTTIFNGEDLTLPPGKR